MMPINKILEVLETAKLKENPLISRAELVQVEGLKPLLKKDIHEESAKLIREAKSEVCMQFYKFDDHSDEAKLIIEALHDLQKKATDEKRTVTVNIIINTRGGLAQTFYKPSKKTILQALHKKLDNEFFSIRFLPHVSTDFGSFHSKLIIADNSKGIIRGCDPADSSNISSDSFETGTLVSGQAAESIRREFLEAWKLSNSLKKEVPLLPYSKDEKKEAKDKIDRPGIFITKVENGNPLKYQSYHSPYKLALLQAIRDSKESIKIITTNLNDSDICQELANACKRGVKIYLTLGKYSNDSSEKKFGGTNRQAIADYLLEKVPALYQSHLDIRWDTLETTKDINRTNVGIHGKYACIDNNIVFIGSSPLDQQALRCSREADLIFESKEDAAAFNKKLFDDKFKQGKPYYLDAYEEIQKKLDDIIGDNKILKNKLEKHVHELSHPDIKDQEKIKKLLATMAIEFETLKIKNNIFSMGKEFGIKEKDILVYFTQLKKPPDIELDSPFETTPKKK